MNPSAPARTVVVMGRTTAKGELGEAMVIADLARHGLGVAVPLGHSLPFDLLLIRDGGRSVERVQVKYTRSDGRSLSVRCTSHSEWVRYRYAADQVDWVATYDETTATCYYVHSSEWGGMAHLTLRLSPPRNGQTRGIRWAKDHLRPEVRRDGSQRWDSNP